MRALLALPLLLLALVPPAAAQDVPAPDLPMPDPFCLLGDFLPETQLYYIVWACTAGQLGVPEPIEHYTGCSMGFPATQIDCNFEEGRLTGPIADCIRDCFIIIPPCWLGPC